MDAKRQRLLDQVRVEHTLAVESDRAARLQRDRRDRTIAKALEVGISQYRIAKHLGISEQAVAKIRKGLAAALQQPEAAPSSAEPVTLAEQAGWRPENGSERPPTTQEAPGRRGAVSAPQGAAQGGAGRKGRRDVPLDIPEVAPEPPVADLDAQLADARARIAAESDQWDPAGDGPCARCGRGQAAPIHTGRGTAAHKWIPDPHRYQGTSGRLVPRKRS